MNSNAYIMLNALVHSANKNTAASAKAILANEPVGNRGLLAQDLAMDGFYGDFVRVVMLGDFLAAYGAADCHNQEALLNILHARLNDW